MQPLVSVIVPIYNTQEYLPRCIESILSQSYPNMEIILLDDGSSDGSGRICHEYAEKDGRIRVIRQPNQGIVAAKKTALGNCHGAYVMFVDSDDWVEEKQLEVLVDAMVKNDCSIVCLNVYLDRENVSIIQKSHIPPGVYETSRIAKDLFYYKDTNQYGILQYSVAKLYERELLAEAVDKMDVRIRFGEDRAIVFGCVFQNIKVCFMEGSYYHYCVRGDSVYHSGNDDHFIELTYFYKWLKGIFEQHEEKEYLLRQLGYYLMLQTRSAIGQKLRLVSMDDAICGPAYEPDLSVLYREKKNVILYGAGKVGKNYWGRLKNCTNINLLGWTDKQSAAYRQKGLDLISMDSLKHIPYDYILVAVKNEGIFLEIKEELRGMGIEDEKIIWGNPLTVTYF